MYLNFEQVSEVKIKVHICGVARNTWCPGCTVAMVLFLQPFLDSFWWAHFGHAAFEVHHLIFQCYVFKGCCDVIHDITALHMCWSHDSLLYKSHQHLSWRGGPGLLFVHSSGLTLSPETCVWLVPNMCRL